MAHQSAETESVDQWWCFSPIDFSHSALLLANHCCPCLVGLQSQRRTHQALQCPAHSRQVRLVGLQSQRRTHHSLPCPAHSRPGRGCAGQQPHTAPYAPGSPPSCCCSLGCCLPAAHRSPCPHPAPIRKLHHMLGTAALWGMIILMMIVVMTCHVGLSRGLKVKIAGCSHRPLCLHIACIEFCHAPHEVCLIISNNWHTGVPIPCIN